MNVKERLNRLIPVAGYLLLSGMVLTLLGFTLYEAWVLHSVGGVLVALVIAGAAVSILWESKRVPCLLLTESLRRRSLWNFVSVVAGALVAYVLSVDLGLGAVTASALVGLLAALIVPDYAVPLYCGSFVGMTSARLLISHWELAIAGTVAAGLYVLTECAFPGFGGKLGTIAFTGSVFTGFGLDREFLITEVPEWPVVLLIVLHAVVATAFTYWMNVDLAHGPVVASSVVGITGGLILPAVFPAAGETLAVMVICASFAGMSSAARLPTSRLVLAVGTVTGLIFVYSMPTLGGAGGKLGTIAFASVLAVRGWVDLIERYLAPPPDSGRVKV